MPYTPPTQRSPASSHPNSPVLSRSHSYVSEINSGASTPNSRRPALPRSASSIAYLNKHRRAPSLNQENDGSKSTQVTTTVHGSIRQSPPPVNNLMIPSGAITTPPDSSSDEEDRGRQLGNLAELQEALQSIEVKRQHSPVRRQHGTSTAPAGYMSPASPPDPSNHILITRPTLTAEARRISHSRSSSEITLAKHAVGLTDAAITSSDDSDDDDCLKIKPPLLRKKSGELVKPALRGTSSKRRPLSAPGTPTFKNVHFNEELTSIRHFHNTEKPIAVSAGSSPVEPYDSDAEYPFDDGEGVRVAGWEIRLTNFPGDSYERKTLPVRVERIFLSSDTKTLIGTVAAANIAFQKLVIARFTLDYWKTTSEVVAEYNNDVRKKQSNDGYDRFNFNIKLADLANLESKTMLLCVRYQVNGQEFWDNNNTMNFQVDFIKKTRSRGGKHGHSVGTVGAVPRSRHAHSSARPRSYPNADDDFADRFDNGRYPPIRLRTNPSLKNGSFGSHRPASTGSGSQGLSNRYDFSASLNAALTTAQAALGEQSRIKLKQKNASAAPASKPTSSGSPMIGQAPGAFSPSGKPDLQSAEYHELIEKYCFYGSAAKSANLTNKASKDVANDTTTQDDSDSGSASGSGTNSSNNSPVMGNMFAASNDGTAEQKSPIYLSRSTSPGPLTGSDPSRGPSPMRFGYPYNHNVSGGIFTETPAPQAMCG